MNKIPIFKLEFDETYRRRFHEGCEKIFDEGYLTNHTMVRSAEARFRELNHSSHALAVSSGTAALEIALKAIDVKDKEVILPANTFIATYLAVIHAGGIPVLADIEDEFYSLNPEQVLSKMTAKTKAVIVVHIGGHVAPSCVDVSNICREKGLILIEDAAHAHFAELNGEKAGNIGDIGCFSFHMTKVVTSGEGGMITTKNKDLYEKCLSLRQFGMDLQNQHSHILDGSNYKLSEFNALAMLLDLDRSRERIEKRRQIAERYRMNLSYVWKVLQDNPHVKGCFYKQVIVPPDHLSRNKIEKTLNAEGVSLTNGVYYRPLHKQPIAQRSEKFPVTDSFCESHICPPCYPELELHEVDRICEILRGLE